MLRQRSLCLLLIAGLLAGGILPASAQSVSSVVDEMQTRYDKQLETIDTYIVETNLYTSYHKKVMENGEPTYQSQTKMKEKSNSSFATGTTPSSAYGLQLDRLKQHATYDGTETVNGTTAHVLKVDAPSKVNPEMKQGDAESMTYYIDAERYVPTRLLMNTKGKSGGGPKTSSVTVNMKNYQTVDGLTLPYRMEFQFNMDMSEKEKKKNGHDDSAPGKHAGKGQRPHEANDGQPGGHDEANALRRAHRRGGQKRTGEHRNSGRCILGSDSLSKTKKGPAEHMPRRALAM